MNADDKPSSLFREQLRAGSHIPATGAYPDGPPMFLLVSQIAKWSENNEDYFDLRKRLRKMSGIFYIFAAFKKVLCGW